MLQPVTPQPRLQLTTQSPWPFTHPGSPIEPAPACVHDERVPKPTRTHNARGAVRESRFNQPIWITVFLFRSGADIRGENRTSRDAIRQVDRGSRGMDRDGFGTILQIHADRGLTGPPPGGFHTSSLVPRAPGGGRRHVGSIAPPPRYREQRGKRRCQSDLAKVVRMRQESSESVRSRPSSGGNNRKVGGIARLAMIPSKGAVVPSAHGGPRPHATDG